MSPLFCYYCTSDASDTYANNSTDDGQDLPCTINVENSPFVPNGDFQWDDISGGHFCDFIVFVYKEVRSLLEA